jgi:hypothetical protein
LISWFLINFLNGLLAGSLAVYRDFMAVQIKISLPAFWKIISSLNHCKNWSNCSFFHYHVKYWAIWMLLGLILMNRKSSCGFTTHFFFFKTKFVPMKILMQIFFLFSKNTVYKFSSFLDLFIWPSVFPHRRKWRNPTPIVRMFSKI